MESRKKVLFALGTRPEAIKLATLIKHAPAYFETRVCITSQHGQMLRQMLDLFGIEEDYDLDVMRPNQTLSKLTSRILDGIVPVLDEFKPDLVVVQGDTTTVFTCALAAFYQRIRVAHVEAGLRSGDRLEPFPEEMNRRLVSHLTDFHFPPTELAYKRLMDEGVEPSSALVSGNTVVDALEYIRAKLGVEQARYREGFMKEGIDTSDPFILVTCHRRENFGQGLVNICKAVRRLADEGNQVVFPVHLNPNVQEVVRAALADHERIHLIDPVEYDKLLYLMDNCSLILSDSGGIQEEAPSFGKRVLVLRDKTERPEGIQSGWLHLVGTDEERIYSEAKSCLQEEASPSVGNPYGDGKATKRILEYLSERL